MREMISEAMRTIEDTQQAQAVQSLLTLKSNTTALSGASTPNFPALMEAVSLQQMRTGPRTAAQMLQDAKVTSTGITESTDTTTSTSPSVMTSSSQRPVQAPGPSRPLALFSQLQRNPVNSSVIEFLLQMQARSSGLQLQAAPIASVLQSQASMTSLSAPMTSSSAQFVMGNTTCTTASYSSPIIHVQTPIMSTASAAAASVSSAASVAVASPVLAGTHQVSKPELSPLCDPDTTNQSSPATAHSPPSPPPDPQRHTPPGGAGEKRLLAVKSMAQVARSPLKKRPYRPLSPGLEACPSKQPRHVKDEYDEETSSEASLPTLGDQAVAMPTVNGGAVANGDRVHDVLVVQNGNNGDDPILSLISKLSEAYTDSFR